MHVDYNVQEDKSHTSRTTCWIIWRVYMPSHSLMRCSWGATDAAGLVLGVMGTLSHVRNTSELKKLSHGGIETQSWTNYSSVLWVWAVEGGEALCLSRTNAGLINPSSGSQETWNWSGSSLTTVYARSWFLFNTWQNTNTLFCAAGNTIPSLHPCQVFGKTHSISSPAIWDCPEAHSFLENVRTKNVPSLKKIY